MGADYPFVPDKHFYCSKNKGNALKEHLSVCGVGVSDYDRAVNSYDKRAVLFDEGKIGLNQIKIYSLQLPEIFFSEAGKKKITVALTFNSETRSTRGDSYLGNRMEFHLFYSVNPQILVEKYGIISKDTERKGVPDDIKNLRLMIFFLEPTQEKQAATKKHGRSIRENPKEFHLRQSL